MKIFLPLLPLAAFLISCGEGPKDVAGGSEAGNACVEGRLYGPAGPGAAANAQVALYSAAFVPGQGAPLARTETDSAGHFHFDSLPAGAYNIEGRDSAGNSALIDSLNVPELTRDSTLYVQDTLRAPGRITGHVLLEGEAGHGGTFVYVPGTPYITGTDSAGRVSLTGLPRGSFTLVIAPTNPDFRAAYRQVVIVSGAATDIGVIILPSLKSTLPAPTGFNLAYDSLLQEVALSWDADASGLVKGYVVYRDDAKLTHAPVSLQSYKDTWDNGLVQDSAYVYKIAAVDSAGNEGKFTLPETVTVSSAYKLVDSVSIDIEPKDVCVDSSGHIYVSNVENTVNKYDGNFNLIYSLSTLSNPAGISADKAGNLYVADDNGITKFDSAGLFIIRFWDTTALGPLGINSYLMRDIAVRDTTLYVAHQGFIALFTTNGDFIEKWNVPATRAIGILDSLVYISDWNNNLTIFSIRKTLINEKPPSYFSIGQNDITPKLCGFNVSNKETILLLSDCWINSQHRISIFELAKNSDPVSRHRFYTSSEVYNILIFNNSLYIPSAYNKLIYMLSK